MSATSLLLRAYYERLHERMEAAQMDIETQVDELLVAEIEAQRFGPLSSEQVEAYREASLAFIFERLETYNPIGIQYTFSGRSTKRAAELEFQLNWYDSRREFHELVAAARALADEETADEKLGELADQLIHQVGAFPDRSIIAAYRKKPTLQKLPDFAVSVAIEQVICRRDTTG